MKAWNRKLTRLIHRGFLPGWLNDNASQGRCVEVGTYEGVFAEQILLHWNGHLTCVDPWLDQPDADYRDGCANGGTALGRNPMKPIFERACARLRPFAGRCTIIRHFSVEGALIVPKASADCVYIDANHKYERAIEDLRIWSERVRPGGLLGIHDCYIREDEVQTCGVADAVWDFSHEIGMRPFLTSCSSAWWILP